MISKKKGGEHERAGTDSTSADVPPISKKMEKQSAVMQPSNITVWNGFF
jgi:hypothetical protein